MKKLWNILCVALLFAEAPAICVARTAARQVDSLLSSMSLEQKVAQLFVVRPEAVVGLDLGACPVGGYCVFAQNFSSPESLDSLVRALNDSEIAPLLCIDEEGGRVARIGNSEGFGVRRFPAMKTVGRRGAKAVYEAGLTIGEYLHGYGFNVDFAPVADVDTNPDNPVIGTRAFSDTPSEAAALVVEFMKGLDSAGVASCLKHFPGHGDTSADSHLGYVEIQKTWEEMLECELVPFRSGIEAGVPMVMVGHICTPAVPELSGEVLPATLSHMWISDVLRGVLGFGGVVITDSMGMNAVSERYDSASAAVMAIEAGVDIVLMPADFAQAYAGVVEAVRSGRIPHDRIDQSLRRVLTLKMKLGILDRK